MNDVARRDPVAVEDERASGVELSDAPAGATARVSRVVHEIAGERRKVLHGLRAALVAGETGRALTLARVITGLSDDGEAR